MSGPRTRHEPSSPQSSGHVGEAVGACVGEGVGSGVGAGVGSDVVGEMVGWAVGDGVGSDVVGVTVGDGVGDGVGSDVTGACVGEGVGACVGAFEKVGDAVAEQTESPKSAQQSLVNEHNSSHWHGLRKSNSHPRATQLSSASSCNPPHSVT